MCPMLVTAPFHLGDDIGSNGVCCAAFRHLPHQKHVTRLLAGQMLEASVGTSTAYRQCKCRSILSHRLSMVQPPVLSLQDLNPPKPLWHEDRRGGQGHQAVAMHPGYHAGYGGGQPGPLSQGAHRMLSHTISAARYGSRPEPQQVCNLVACF